MGTLRRIVIVNDEQRAVMEFIATANRGGYRPTGREVNEWRREPNPRPRRRGKLVDPGVPEIPERRVRKGLSPLQTVLGASWVEQIQKSYRSPLNAANLNYWSIIRPAVDALAPSYLGAADYNVIPGRPGRPARYAPDKPPEKFLAHLRRLGWIERDPRGRYGVTQLGHALLRAEAATDGDGQDSPVMVLTAEDELAYGRVLGVISECGDALIVDAYLGTQQLVHILQHSSASRFLVGNKLAKGRVTELAATILLTPTRDGAVRELRSADLHDRYVVGENKVYGLGSSLNGIGKSMTTLIEMPDAAARAIRSETEDLWADAKVIARTEDQVDSDDDAAGQNGVASGS